MGILTRKPRGRNGRRPKKLTPGERRELGAYAYRLKRGAPIPTYRLPNGADEEWPLTDAAKAIVDAIGEMLEGDLDGRILPKAIKTAHEKITAHVDGLRFSDFRERLLRRLDPNMHPELVEKRDGHHRPDVEPMLPASRHWVRESIKWVEIQYGETIGGDLVRSAEKEYRQRVELWEYLARDA
jgi:hypothetical protein